MNRRFLNNEKKTPLPLMLSLKVASIRLLSIYIQQLKIIKCRLIASWINKYVALGNIEIFSVGIKRIHVTEGVN